MAAMRARRPSQVRATASSSARAWSWPTTKEAGIESGTVGRTALPGTGVSGGGGTSPSTAASTRSAVTS